MSILASEPQDKDRDAGAGGFLAHSTSLLQYFSRSQRDKTSCEYDKEAWEERN